MSRLGRVWESVRTGLADSAELQERMALRNRPWAENYLHWSNGEHGPELHGTLLPPRGWRHFSVTHGGWCQGLPARRSR
jgi:hypothetical protein